VTLRSALRAEEPRLIALRNRLAEEILSVIEV
jgi:hypothetical protein